MSTGAWISADAGFKIMYAPDAKLWHKGRTGGAWIPHYINHQTRNDYVLIAKHLSRPKVFISAAMLALWYQPKFLVLLRVRPTKSAQVKAFLRGQFHGLTGCSPAPGASPLTRSPRSRRSG